MKISIITVCFNSAATLEETIRSVVNQDYADVEYIVVDGGSTDGTAVIVERYKDRIQKYICEKDKGMYDAINKGIGLATGDVIGLLHADDRYANVHILSKVAETLTRSGADSLYGDLQYVSRTDASKVIRQWKSCPYNQALFLKGWMPPHPTYFVKRSVYERFGCYNTSLSISADYELMLRHLYKHKVSTTYLPEVIVQMRTGGLSNKGWTSRLKANQEDRKAWKINGLKPGFFTLIRKPLSKLGQFF